MSLCCAVGSRPKKGHVFFLISNQPMVQNEGFFRKYRHNKNFGLQQKYSILEVYSVLEYSVKEILLYT